MSLGMHRSTVQQESSLILQAQVDVLNEKTTQMQKTITEIQTHTKQVCSRSSTFFL